MLKELKQKVFEWMVQIDGMSIPLRVDRGQRAADRKPR